MTEKRLKQIKDSLIEDLDSIDYYGSKTAKEGLELYYEVIGLRNQHELYKTSLDESQEILLDYKQRIHKAIVYIEPKIINEFIHTDYIYTMIDILRGEGK